MCLFYFGIFVSLFIYSGIQNVVICLTRPVEGHPVLNSDVINWISSKLWLWESSSSPRHKTFTKLYSVFFLLMNRLDFLDQFKVYRKIKQKVKKKKKKVLYSPSPSTQLPLLLTSWLLLYYSHVALVCCPCYNWWANIDTALLTQVHRLYQSSFVLYNSVALSSHNIKLPLCPSFPPSQNSIL